MEIALCDMEYPAFCIVWFASDVTRIVTLNIVVFAVKNDLKIVFELKTFAFSFA